MGLLDGLMEFLETNQADPGTYLLFFFLFIVANAVFLPVAVEIGLFWNPGVPFVVKAVVLGAGKAVGSIIVFLIGVKIGSWAQWRWLNWLVVKSESFVNRYGYYALYALMSIPFMTDTVPLYVFSLLNKERHAFSWKGFALTNFLAGVTRASLFWVLMYVFGVRLF